MTMNTAGLEEVVVVGVGTTSLGLPLDRVHEITRPLERTPVPRGGDHILGVVNLRGDIVTLLDLGMILFNRACTDEKSGRTVIVQDDEERIGLRIDRVGDVVELPLTSIERLPTHVPDD
ncbi:MAG TPA: CheW domain-containing protein, partial [Planctomycetota bacterium]|nr:CheW domain-containing protein [Planctomycetota bacterium]